MKENLNRMRGLIFSQQVLLRLSNLGLSRETSYEWVQRNALKVWSEGKDFKSLLAEDTDIRKYLGLRDLEEIFDLKYHLKHVDELFGRVFGTFS
jgi:adenylosuccinate lyase